MVREEIDKDSNDYQNMYVQKFGRKLVKPLRIEKNRNGQKKNSAGSMRGIYFVDPDDEEYSGNISAFFCAA